MKVDWPLNKNIIRRNSVRHTFGMVRKNADGTPRPHQGWDFAARSGTLVFSIADGVIERMAFDVDYGFTILINHGSSIYSFYAHLSGDKLRKEGDKVSMGQLIAMTGTSGNAEGLPIEEQHLHFEIRTQAVVGYGLTGRKSPLAIYPICPLNEAANRANP